jgi:hypothetical protein
MAGRGGVGRGAGVEAREELLEAVFPLVAGREEEPFVVGGATTAPRCGPHGVTMGVRWMEGVGTVVAAVFGEEMREGKSPSESMLGGEEGLRGRFWEGEDEEGAEDEEGVAAVSAWSWRCWAGVREAAGEEEGDCSGGAPLEEGGGLGLGLGLGLAGSSAGEADGAASSAERISLEGK